MAKRRKVANILALAILSELSTQALHPYEMAAQLRAHGKDQDMKINWGSLYTVVANLEKHGLIEAVGTTRQGRRPERTVYRITDAGRAETKDWLRELVSVPNREYPKFEAALSVMGILGPDETTELLRKRLAALDRTLVETRAGLTADAEAVPRIFLVEVEYRLALLTAETEWVRAILGELVEGTLPGLAVWRNFHETGNMPDTLAPLFQAGLATDDDPNELGGPPTEE